MQEIIQSFRASFFEFQDKFIEHLPELSIALVIAVLTYALARFGRKHFVRVIPGVSRRTPGYDLLRALITLSIVAIGLFCCLMVLDLDGPVTSLLAGAGVAGLVIGLAFQEPIINAVSGFVVAGHEEYGVGDLIETHGLMGYIEGVTIRHTTMVLLSGEKIVIPNKLIVQNILTNYTRAEGRRVELNVGVSYNENLDQVGAVTEQAIASIDGLDTSRDIDIVYDGFGDSSINLRVFFWLKPCLQDKFLKAKSDAVKNIKSAFDRQGILIPFPIRTLQFETSKGERQHSSIEAIDYVDAISNGAVKAPFHRSDN